MDTASWTPEKLRQEADRLAQAGQTDAARRLVGEALRLAPEDVSSWLLAARLAGNAREEKYCLKRVLKIDLDQPWARERLRELAGVSTEPLADSSTQRAVREDTPAPGPTALDPAEIHLAPPSSPPERVAPFVALEEARTAEPTAPENSPAPTTPSTPDLASPAQPPARTKRSRRRTDPVFVFLSGMVVVFAGLACLVVVALMSRLATPEVTPATLMAPLPSDEAEDCRGLITRALKVAESDCSRLGPNQVCYGNTHLTALLAPGTTDPFEARGDIIGVGQLKRISASPLDVTSKDWGVAIFKLMANVPRSLPGQNVTFIVFGNTSLDNASGDLQAFYFSSQLGQVSCARLASDGILIHMPDGAGLTFTANGTAITLLGTAELKARPNENMVLSLSSGSAKVTAAGQTQFLGAGQEVKVPLGGASGREPAGPPLPPSDIAAGGLPATCGLLGMNCNPGDVPTVDPTQAATAIAQAEVSSTPSTPGTPGPSPTPTPTSRVATQSSTPTAAQSGTPLRTSTATPTLKTPTGTPTASALPRTATPSQTWTRVPTARPTTTPSNTNPPPPTATATLVPTATPTWTLVPVCQFNAANLGASGTSLTAQIQNNGPAPATIASMTLNWPHTPASQKIMEIHLGGAVIDRSNYTKPPSSIPLGGLWTGTGPATDRLVPGNTSKALEFVFQNELGPTGYSLTIQFDNGCSASASR